VIVRVFGALFAKHRRFEANVDAFADGELREPELGRFEAHLQGCDSCRAAVRQAQGMKSLVAALPELPVMRSFAITESMLKHPAPAVPAPGRGFGAPLRTVQGFGAAAVALLAVLVVVDLGGGGSGSLASRDGDFDAEAPLHDGLTITSEAALPAADANDDAAGTGQLNGNDAAEATPGGVEGAGVNPPRPLPTPVPESGGEGDDVFTGGADDDGRISDGVGFEDETAAALASAATNEKDGTNWLRIGQVAAAAGALLAGVAYLGLRRRDTA
jgi:hypothetical protein